MNAQKGRREADKPANLVVSELREKGELQADIAIEKLTAKHLMHQLWILGYPQGFLSSGYETGL